MSSSTLRRTAATRTVDAGQAADRRVPLAEIVERGFLARAPGP